MARGVGVDAGEHVRELGPRSESFSRTLVGERLQADRHALAGVALGLPVRSDAPAGGWDLT